MNFQMFKLVLEKAEEPEIKLPTSAGSWGKQESYRKKYLFLLYWLCQSLWLCGSQSTIENSEMGIPDRLTCLLRELYAGQEATVKTGQETTDWFQIGKGVHQGCILSPCLFKVKVKLLSRARLFATPWIVASTKLLGPWDFQGKSTGVGCHFLIQGIFPTQGSNPGLSHCRQTVYRLSHQKASWWEWKRRVKKLA